MAPTGKEHGIAEERPDPPESLLEPGSASSKENHERPKRPRYKFNFWQNIGLTGFLALVVGSILITVSCFMLSFLWVSAEIAQDRIAPFFRNTVVSNGWVVRYVTLFAAAIRMSITVQLGFTAAGLSGLILETYGARFRDIPTLSFERASKSGFFNILPAVLRQSSTGWGAKSYSIIAITGVIITIASNFISTILLSDFADMRIAAPGVTQPLVIASKHPANYDAIYNGASYWRSKPSAEWRFAENRTDKPQYGDTGDTYRAMLPLSEVASRTPLESYSGPALVANTRTICLAPSLHNVSVGFVKKISETRKHGPVSLTNANWTANMFWGEDKECQLHYAHDDTSQSGWPLSVCLGQHPEILLPTPLENMEDPKTGDYYHFRRVLIVNSTNRIVPETKSGSNVSIPIRLRKLKMDTKSDSVWTEAFDTDDNPVLRATVCLFNEYPPQVYNVNMTGERMSSGPSYGFKEPEYNKLQVDAMFNNREWPERDILDLDIGPLLNISSRQESTQEQQTDAYFLGIFNDLPLGSRSGWGMAPPHNSDDWSWAAHSAHISQFQKIIRDGSDPAPAVQDLMTRLYQMAYYDHLDEDDLEFPVTTVHSIVRFVPTRWTGYLIVLALCVCHLCMVWITFFVLMLGLEYSALGNTWHTLAQTARMTDAIEWSEVLLDSEVTKWAKTTGRDTQRYHLDFLSHENKVGISMVRKPRENPLARMTREELKLRYGKKTLQ